MTSAAFERCHAVTKGWEGGWVNDPDDRGGPTNFGVTQGTYDGYRDATNLPRQTVRNITMGEARDIYFNTYWLKPECDRLFTGVDLAVYDFGVNSGPSRARKYLVAHLDPQNRHAETVKNICQARLSFVRGLGTFWKFGRGWSNRIADVQAKGVAWALTAMSGATAAHEQLEREAEQKKAEQGRATGTGAVTGTGTVGGGADVAVNPEHIEQVASWPIFMLIGLGAAFTLYFFWKASTKGDQKKAYRREAEMLAKTVVLKGRQMTLESLLFSLGGQVAGKLIARRFGPEVADLADDVLNTLGQAFGVADATDEDKLVQAIQAKPEAEARRAVASVELQSADLLLARVKLQKEENEGLTLLNAQIAAEKKGHWFGWAWRPAWMWGLLLLWIWAIAIAHLVNAIMKWAIPQTDLVQLAAVTVAISGLYMGGHTIKDWVARKWGTDPSS